MTYGVLTGLRVVEQGTFITGPAAAMMLADLGADVVKVEAPGRGDPFRAFGEDLYSPHFQAYNRNKRSLTLDAKSAADQDLFRQLIGTADVYIQNFRPGAAARLGADWETLHAINPRLVYCSISGFGPDGPYAERPAYDSVAQAVSGFLAVATDPVQPRLLGPAIADAVTGAYAATGILGALVERGRTGVGRHVEISMLEAMMHFAVEPFTGYFATGEAPTSVDRPRVAQAFVVACADGKLIALHLSSVEKFWAALIAAVDQNGALGDDPRFAQRRGRIDNYDALNQELGRIFSRQTRDAWMERLAGFDLPHAPVNAIDEALADPQARHLGIEAPVSDPPEGGAQSAIRPPFRFDGARADSVAAAPTVGQHTGAIRGSLAEQPGEWPGAA